MKAARPDSLDTETRPTSSARQGPTGSPRDPVDSLTVNLTSRCNLSCLYCYRHRVPPRDLAWPDLRSGLDWALSRRRGGLEVLFSGGEPLLEFELLKRAVRHLTLGDDINTVTIRILTNGLLLDGKTLDYLVNRDIHVRLSLDGVPHAQKARGEGTWSRLDQLLRDMERHHPVWFRSNLQTTMTVTPSNVRWLADSVRYQLDRGIQSIKAGAVMTRSSGDFTDVHDLMNEQYEEVFDANLAHFRATGRIPFILLRRYEGLPSPEPVGSRLCSAATGSNPVLDTDGKLYSCMMFSPSGFNPDHGALHAMAEKLLLGRADDPHIEDRWRTLGNRIPDVSLFDFDRPLQTQARDCGECEAKPGCTICPYTVLASGDGPECFRVPTFTCSWNRLTWHYKQRFPPLALPASPLPTLADIQARRKYWASRHEK